jgi:hypothetical protein
MFKDFLVRIVASTFLAALGLARVELHFLERMFLSRS